MAENHLLAKTLHNVRNIKLSPFLRYTGIEYNVKEHVTELLLNIAFRLLENGVAQFIDLLNSHRAERLHCLGSVPGTILPEFAHHIEYPAELRQLLLIGMYHCLKAKYTPTLLALRQPAPSWEQFR